MTDAKPRNKHARPKRGSRAVRIAVTGVVLGLIVFGVGAFMNRPGPATVPEAVAPATVGSATPTGTASVPGTSSPSVTGTTTAPGSGTATATPDDTPLLPADAYTKPVSNLASLLPKTVPGYTVGIVETTTVSAIVPLQPTTAGPMGKATIVVLTVFDKKSVAGAKAFVDTFQRAYPKDLGAVSVGSLTGRFGTDGSHLAAVTFSRGRYAFEIVLTVTRGAPRDLKAVTLEAAEAFSATKTAP